ncbi:MAG: SMC family ATPase [Candidatus Aenigmatarchaeota archaeon]
MITKVKLKNWRSHLDSELNFSEGTNCFVGHSGSGKTSIMDAICFGLFGTFLQLQQKKIKLEDIIMKKPQAKEQAEVTVYFDIDGNEWSVKRTVTKGKTTAELRKNGELIEGPQPSKVTEEVEKILKMNYELFSRAVYSEQNQLDMFLTIPKGQRMKKIDELLAIDRFEKARLNTKAIANKCKTVLEEKENLIKNLEADESLNKLEVIKKEFFDLKEKEEKLKKQLEDVSNRKIKIARDVLILKEQQKKLQFIEEESKKYIALIDLTESELEKIKAELVEYAEKTIEELNAESNNISLEIEKLSKQIQEERLNLDKLKEEYAEENAKIKVLEEEKLPKLECDVKELEEVASKLKKTPLKKAETELKNKQKDLEKNQLSLQKTIAKISELEDSIRELNLAGSICPVCNSKLTEIKKDNLLNKKKKQLEELKKALEGLNNLNDKLQEELNKADKKFKEIEKLQERFEQIKDSEKQYNLLTKELKDLKEKIKVFLNQKKMFEKNIELLENNLNELKNKQENIKRILLKKEEANEKLERLKEYSQKINQINLEREMLSSFSLSILEKTEEEYQSVIALERELQTHLSNQTEIINEKQKIINEIENKKRFLENCKAEAKRIEAIIEQLSLLESALEATQEQLRKDFVLAVNEAMQTIWPELYPYKDIFNIRLNIEEGDYVLQLQDSSGWISADGVASGGERSIACLALRIALSLVLAPNLGMLVLDEPTHNLDSKSIEVLSLVLREKINQIVEQCFLITHDEKLKEAVSGYCYELSRDKSKDGFTKIFLVSGPEN